MIYSQRTLIAVKIFCLHHHVFSSDCLEKLFNWLGMGIIEIREFYGNYMALAIK
ncbi:MAG: hypothetical protein IJT21_01040 [Synergistaceae bacterium]|nr:hypothetical protein [Synergistaceae bacterium]